MSAEEILRTGLAALLFALVFAVLGPMRPVARFLHLLSLDRTLWGEFGERYERHGRYVLAAMGPLGWAVALFVGFPPFISALMVAFISGAVIVNSTVTELPRGERGRLVPFLAGGLIYGLILIPFG